MMMMYSPDDWKKLYNGQTPWTDPKIVDQLTKWAALKTKGCTNEDVLANNESVSQFESGKAAMTLEGSWGFGEFYDKLGDKVGVFAPPFSDTPDQGRGRVPGQRLRGHQLLAEQAGGGRLPGLDGDARGAEDHRRRRPHPDRRTAREPTAPLAIAMLDYAKAQGYTRYPMIDNVMQPEVTNVGHDAADRRPRRDDDAAAGARKASRTR